MQDDDFSEAVEKAGKRLRAEKVFQYKTIEVRGEPYSPLIPDEVMIAILNFKGTGEKRKFYDLVKQVEQMLFDEYLRILTNDDEWYNPENAPNLYKYIVQNNFQVIFEKGDISVRKPI